jgi:hypothetical protein
LSISCVVAGRHAATDASAELLLIQFSDNPETTEILPTASLVPAVELEQIELEIVAERAPDAPEPKVDSDAEDAALDIEDSTRLYLREISRVPLLTAEEEVVLAKAIELGLRIRTEPWTAVLDLHEWTLHETEAKTRAKNPVHALPFGAEAHRIVRNAVADDSAGDLLVTAPRFGFTAASAEAQGGPAAELLERARNLRAVYNERLDAEAFMTLLDWVHEVGSRPAIPDEK